MKANAPEKIYLEKVYPDNGVLPNGLNYNQSPNNIEYIRADAFIEKAVEGRVIDDGGEIHLVVPELPTITRNMDDGERVKVLIFK